MKEEHIYALTTLAAAAVAEAVTRQIIHGGWRLAHGVRPPDNPAARDVSWRDAIVFSAATGLLVGVSRVVGKRLATSAMEARLGRKPRGANRRQLA